MDGSSNPTFIIDSVTGQITVGLNLAVLDFETTPQIVMQVSATDSDGYSGTGDLTIALADLNDPVTVVTAGVPGSFSVDEHSPSTTVLYDFEADDVDTNDVHTWTLYERDGSDNMDGFAIDSDDGELRIGNPARVDFEEDPDRTFGVRVTDQGGVSSETFVTVNLDDLPNIVIPGDITFLTTGRNIWADSESGTFSTQSDSLSRTYVKGQDTISKDIGGSGVMPPMHIDLDIGGHVGFDAALDINNVTATMTLENGVTTFSWTVGDDLNITVPADADVNGDGQVSYTIDYTLDSTFTNTTAFGVSMTVYIDIGQGTATVYSVSGGNLQELASIPFIMLADQDMTFTGFAESIPFVFPLGGFNTPTTTGFFDLINP